MTRLLYTVGLTLALALGVSSSALGIDPAAPGALQVLVAVSQSPEYIKQWMSTSPQSPVTIKRLHMMKVGDTAYVAFIVTGYAITRNSDVDLVVDCKIFNPSGSVLFDLPRYAKQQTHVSGPAFVIADPALDLKIDQGDQVGKYRIVATVHDRVSGKVASGEYTLEVTQRLTTG